MNESDPSEFIPYLPVPASPPLPALSVSQPGVARTIALSVLFFGLIFGTVIVVECLKYFAGLVIDDFASLFIQQLVAWPVTLWVGLIWSGRRFRDACPLKPFPLRIVPALVVGSMGACIVLNAVANLIPMPDILRKILTESFANADASSLVLAMVLGAPLAEELFFRGLVLNGYLGRYSVTKAVWASAIVFAVFHLNPWQGVVALPLGLIFAWMYLRTGSLLPSIVSHAVTNFTSLFLLGPLGSLFGYDAQAMKDMHQVPVEMVAVGLAITTVAGYFLWRQMGTLKPQTSIDLTPAADGA